MKKVFVIGLVLLLFMVIAAPAGATPPESINLVLNSTYPNFPSLADPTGTWHSSGLINSVGVLDSVPSHFGAGNPPGKPFQTAHVTSVISDGNGTITIKTHVTGVEWTFDGPDAHFEGSGTWVIISGTGAYENLRGRGAVDLSGDASFAAGVMTATETLTGQAHFDPQ